jgi:hypothetical protein
LNSLVGLNKYIKIIVPNDKEKKPLRDPVINTIKISHIKKIIRLFFLYCIYSKHMITNEKLDNIEIVFELYSTSLPKTTILAVAPNLVDKRLFRDNKNIQIVYNNTIRENPNITFSKLL